MSTQCLPLRAAQRNWILITALLCASCLARLSAQAIGPLPASAATASDLGLLATDDGAASDALSRYLLTPGARQTHARERGGFTATFGPYTRHTGKGNYNAHPAFTALEWETVQLVVFGTNAGQMPLFSHDLR